MRERGQEIGWGSSKRRWRKGRRREGGCARELREFMCKIKRIKPFVICDLPGGQSLVSHRSLELFNQSKLCKPFQIYAGLKGHFIVRLKTRKPAAK